MGTPPRDERGRFLPLEARARELIPNDNDPADVPPATVGPPSARPGDPNGFEIIGDDTPPRSPPRIWPSAWSGWPEEWMTPAWSSRFQQLVDSAWMCLDLNASILATMPPYTVKGARLVGAPSWLENPDPDLYTSWDEFAKQLWWDYQLGEVFVLATAWFADGFPARFHVVDPWLVNVEMVGGRREYTIGSIDVTDEILHIRYKSSTSDGHGHGPLEAGRSRLLAAGVLQRYATQVVQGGGIPYYVLKHPLELKQPQVDELLDQWWQSRISRVGQPAVLSGGVEIEQLQMSPADMALLELSQFNESRIAVLLGVPPFLVGLPSGGDSMTYSNVNAIFDYHWRAGLKPKASPVVKAISGWALPRGTNLEINRDEYVRPDPYQRAQTWEILIRIGVLTAEQVAELERFMVAGTTPEPQDLTPAGVLT